METHSDGKIEWISLFVMGRDRPGIIAAIAKALLETGYNIEDLTQTVLRGQFAMILLASRGQKESGDRLQQATEGIARELGLDIHLRTVEPQDMVPFGVGETEPYVLTVRGEDRPGLVYGIASLLAERNINITNHDAKAIPLGGKREYIQFYEVDIPKGLEFTALQAALRKRGEELGVSVDLQHRDIFRAINQI